MTGPSLDTTALGLTLEEWDAIALSLRVSLVAVAGMLVPGVALGWLLARKRFWGRTVVDAVVHLPLVLPPVVTGYLLLLLFGRRGLLGEPLGLEIAFTWKAAALASAVVAFPLMVRAVRLSMELVDARYEEAAATLGAPPWRVWTTVTLPLALPGVLTGAVLAFARSLGEFGATITFAGNLVGETRTLPLALFTYTEVPGGQGPALRLMLISLVLSLLALLASELLARRARRLLGGP